MPAPKPFVLLLAAALLGCGQTAPPVADPSATPAAEATTSPAGVETVSPSASPEAMALPDKFTALGTEPFWAAKVAGKQLTYMTPEDQVGQTIAIAREAGAEFVALTGTLAGKPLALTVTKGPCSDGMSDVVYLWSVVRRLGDDEQRGCARIDPRETPPGPMS